jgi:hypothetical protein
MLNPDEEPRDGFGFATQALALALGASHERARVGVAQPRRLRAAFSLLGARRGIHLGGRIE